VISNIWAFSAGSDKGAFSGGIRDKYAEQSQQGKNVVIIDPELAKSFPDSESVNGIRAVAGRLKQPSPPRNHK
jgi:hypothetical protein